MPREHGSPRAHGHAVHFIDGLTFQHGRIDQAYLRDTLIFLKVTIYLTHLLFMTAALRSERKISSHDLRGRGIVRIWNA